jgi:hypothetical protein
MFSVTSRYHGIELAEHVVPDGRRLVYVRRRFLPVDPPAAVLAEHVVAQGDRLDNITARHLGDPEQFWRVCDANLAVRPDDLTAADRLGSRLLIPLPTGSP